MHNKFFGPTREQSYLDNWDGELDDMVASLQEQVLEYVTITHCRYIAGNY